MRRFRLCVALRNFIELGLVLAVQELHLHAARALPGYPADSLNSFSAESEPFRRDDEEIEGRDFDYSDEDFLHRFTYRIRTDWQNVWNAEQEGIVLTAGSATTNELYAVHLLKKTIALNETFTGIIRHQRSEDFDGRYDRLLTGVGVNLPHNWSVSLVGDIVAEKEDIDPQLELAWNSPWGHRLRVIYTATDALFDEKNDEDAEYTRQPYTLFAEGRARLSEQLMLAGWMNYNSELELRMGDGRDFTYNQTMYQAAVLWQPNGNWQLLLSAGGQDGERALRSPESAVTSQLERAHAGATFEVQFRHTDAFKTYYGYNYFYLSEIGLYPNVLPLGGELKRREHMIYSGIIWQISDQIGISPGVYLDVIDNRYPADEEEIAERVEKLLAKITMPLEYSFSPRAKMTVNPTYELHKTNFGGLNIQFLVLF
ncbi:MAG TPA: TonB-dependent receptor [Oligoflexia bacterium]|nr:TonB-dependent receptor [Oligoflexia bacterium]